VAHRNLDLPLESPQNKSPELSYDELTIANGGDASAAFFNLREEKDGEKIRTTRDALLEYCGLDTLAMVKILEKLRRD